MVASTDIVIKPVYLDCRKGGHLASAGGVSTMEDNTEQHMADSGVVSTTERWDRIKRSWQLSWWGEEDSIFMMKFFEIFKKATGFLFISPAADERSATDQPLRNTVTGENEGDGVTTTFQLQWTVSLPYDVGVGSAESDPVDVNYPIEDTVVAYKNGIVAALSNVNLLTGVVTFATAPGNGVATTADYERAFAALITSDTISRTLLENEHAEVRSLQIAEIL